VVARSVAEFFSKPYHPRRPSSLRKECGEDACSSGQRYVPSIRILRASYLWSIPCLSQARCSLGYQVIASFLSRPDVVVNPSTRPKLTPHFRHHHLDLYYNSARSRCSRKPTGSGMDCSATSSPCRATPYLRSRPRPPVSSRG
jgi:hypothetical protein